MAGNLGGVHGWDGLDQKVEQWYSHDFWGKVPWAGHACKYCRTDIVIGGQTHAVQAAVIDGLTANRTYKCSVLGCTMALPRWDARYEITTRVALSFDNHFPS